MKKGAGLKPSIGERIKRMMAEVHPKITRKQLAEGMGIGDTTLGSKLDRRKYKWTAEELGKVQHYMISRGLPPEDTAWILQEMLSAFGTPASGALPELPKGDSPDVRQIRIEMMLAEILRRMAEK